MPYGKDLDDGLAYDEEGQEEAKVRHTPSNSPIRTIRTNRTNRTIHHANPINHTPNRTTHPHQPHQSHLL